MPRKSCFSSSNKIPSIQNYGLLPELIKSHQPLKHFQAKHGYIWSSSRVDLVASTIEAFTSEAWICMVFFSSWSSRINHWSISKRSTDIYGLFLELIKSHQPLQNFQAKHGYIWSSSEVDQIASTTTEFPARLYMVFFSSWSSRINHWRIFKRSTVNLVFFSSWSNRINHWRISKRSTVIHGLLLELIKSHQPLKNFQASHGYAYMVFSSSWSSRINHWSISKRGTDIHIYMVVSSSWSSRINHWRIFKRSTVNMVFSSSWSSRINHWSISKRGMDMYGLLLELIKSH